MGAARHPTVEPTLAAVRGLDGGAEASILDRPERLGLPWAALVNGVAVHVEDYDDTHLRTVMHPGAPVVPAALAVREDLGCGGEALLDAVTLGIELSLRVGNGLGRSH